ncbi:MAG TPA: DUF368 domain-containing protein [Candidatus Borkfalkia avistercoris]|uniref:DUF368 domain-containing protein n=1 Tax=Candidatus Borkfalkia avistercoris TaxID=2838504 RepID=A0A9D2A7Q4_9FIRM|nr:DUF368 domain-containing protein [Candidatus Borkfalkia avistercoris]
MREEEKDLPEEGQPSPVTDTVPSPAADAAQAPAGEEVTAESLKYKNGKEVAKGGLLGVFIGLAVIVPGVSGSTVAIIFKLYHKLLFAIGNIFKKFKKCAAFLLPVVIGLVIGFVAGFFAIQRVLNVAPFTVIGLFAGLMLGAFPAVKDEIKGEKKSAGRVLLFVLGLTVPIVISLVSTLCVAGAHSLENLQWYHYLLFLVLGYIVAITQIVPGLSATAILMVFGYFSPLMDSVHLSYWQANPQVFLVYLCLVIGFAAGLVTFSKALTKIFDRAKKPAFFLITGLSLGSVVTMFFNPDVYAVYKSWAAGSPFALDLSLGITLFAVGCVVAYLFVRYERKKGG